MPDKDTKKYICDEKAALERLRRGNLEYCSADGASSCVTEADRRYHVDNGQHPFACIICCSDSRVVPEHIFSTGIGSLFTVRTAGNVIGTHEMGSVEYAVLHLHTPLVVVMGHTHCGAVSAALTGHAEGMMKPVTDRIRNAVSDPEDVRACEWENCEQGVKDLLESPLLKEQADAGQVTLVAAMYDTESGRVVFREE